jgi:DNA-binding IclR family transcriptional regulator
VQRDCNARGSRPRDTVKEVRHVAAPPARERGLSTARAVLKVLALLAQRPDGVRAADVAQALGKSVSTAYYLLTSLCEEGFAEHDGVRYRLRPAVPIAAPHGDLPDAVDELFRRTHKRAYLGCVKHGAIEITVVRGRQGMPRMPGLGARIRESAHATAMGKVVLAHLRPTARKRYAAGELHAYTSATITTPPLLLAELERVRRRGYALDRMELDPDFCCVAAPVLDRRGLLVGTIAVSASTRAFDAEREQLIAAVRDVAASHSIFQPHAENDRILDARAGRVLALIETSVPDEGGATP